MHTGFYVGTFVPVFAAQYFSQRFGAKLTITVGLLVGVFCNSGIPLVAFLFPHFLVVVGLRFVMGVAQGMVFADSSKNALKSTEKQ
jgi:MFS family permease